MTTPDPDPAGEAAAAALYTQIRSDAIAQAEHPSVAVAVQRALPAAFEDLDDRRREHYRRVARAAVDAWLLHATLHGPAS